MVEFALVMSLVFLPMVLGTFDLVRAYVGFTVATNVAREVSRNASAHVGDGGAWSGNALSAGMNLAVGVDSSQLNMALPTLTRVDGITPYSATDTPYFQPYVTVRGTYSYRPLTPMLGRLFSDQTISVITPVG